MFRTETTRPVRVSTLVLAVLAFLSAALMLTYAPSARADAAPAVYTDVSGDSGLAPDIQTVAISDSGAVVTLAVTATGVQSAADNWVDVTIESDQGGVYGLQVLATKDGLDPVHFWTLTSGGWTPLPETPTTTFGASGDTYTFTFGTADFGGATSFDFYVSSGVGDGAYEDWAPEEDYWSYSITSAPQPTGEDEASEVIQYVPAAGALAGLTGSGAVYVFGEDDLWHYLSPQAFTAGHYDWNLVAWYGQLTGQIGEPIPGAAPPGVVAPVIQTVVPKPVIGAPLTVPAKPVAGKTFTVSFRITNPNTGVPLTKAAMICDPRVNGVVLKHSEHFKDGIATLSFKIPKTAKGKTLQVHLKMRVENDVGTTRVATFRIS